MTTTEKSELRVHLLGTGPAEADIKRVNTSLILESDQPVLVDCSGSPGAAILRHGFALKDIHDVILTHAHTDHLYAVPSLVHTIWLDGGIRPGKVLRFHGFGETLQAAQRLLDVFGFEEKADPVKIEWHELAVQDQGEFMAILPNWELSYFRVTHGSLDALGVAAVSGNRRFVYTADSIADARIERSVATATDLLIHDCGGGLTDTSSHAGAEGIANILQGGTVREAALIHLASRSTDEIERIRQAAKGASSTLIRVPNDGDVLSV